MNKDQVSKKLFPWSCIRLERDRRDKFSRTKQSCHFEKQLEQFKKQ